MHKLHAHQWLTRALALFFAAGVACLFSLSVYAQTVKDVHLKDKQKEDEEAQGEVAEDKDGEELTREATKALYEAQETMKTDDFAGARQILLDYLATEPETIPIVLYHMLGYTYSAEGNMVEAQKVFKQGHEAAPDDEALLLNYAIATWELEKFEEAAPLFEKAYDTREKKESKYLQQAAVAWYQAENLEEAERILLRMFDLPETPQKDWYQMIINIYMELERNDDAEKYVRMFLKQDPMQADYWRLLAQLRLDKEDYRSAAGALEISYNVKAPTKPKRWEDLADLYYYLAAPLKAAGSMELAYKDKKPDDKYAMLIELYTRAQRFDKAIEHLNNLIAKKPTAEHYMQKGTLLNDAGRVEDAIEAWDECIKLDSKHGECLIAAGLGYWDLKDWDAARDEFDRAANLEQFRLQAEDALAVLDDLESAKYDPSFDFRKGRY